MIKRLGTLEQYKGIVLLPLRGVVGRPAIMPKLRQDEKIVVAVTKKNGSVILYLVQNLGDMKSMYDTNLRLGRKIVFYINGPSLKVYSTTIIITVTFRHSAAHSSESATTQALRQMGEIP